MRYAYIFTNNDYQKDNTITAYEIAQDEDIFLVPSDQIITEDYIKSLEEQFPADKTKLVFFTLPKENLNITNKDGKEILNRTAALQLTFSSVINKVESPNGTEENRVTDEVNTSVPADSAETNHAENSNGVNDFDNGTSTPSDHYQSVTSQLDPLTHDNQSTTTSFEFATDTIKNQAQIEQPSDTLEQISSVDLPSAQVDSSEIANTEISESQPNEFKAQNPTDVAVANKKEENIESSNLEKNLEQTQLTADPQVESLLQSSVTMQDSKEQGTVIYSESEVHPTITFSSISPTDNNTNQTVVYTVSDELPKITPVSSENNQNIENSDPAAGVFYEESHPKKDENSALDSDHDQIISEEEVQENNNLSLPQASDLDFKKEHESYAKKYREKVIAAIKDYLLTIKKVDIKAIKHAIFNKAHKAPSIFNMLFEEEINASLHSKQRLGLDRGTIRSAIYLILLEKEVIPHDKTLLFISSLLHTKNSTNLRSHVVNFLSIGSGTIYKKSNAKIKEYNNKFIFNITEDSIRISIDSLYEKDEQKYKENMDIVSQLNNVIENIAHDKTSEFEQLGNILQFHNFIPGLKDVSAGRDVKSTLYYKSPPSQPIAETSAELITIAIARIKEYLRDIKNIEPQSSVNAFKNNEFPKPFLFFYTSRTGARRASAYLSLLEKHENDPAPALHVLDALLHAENSKELRWYVAEKILDGIAPNNLSSDILSLANTERKINKAATTVMEKIKSIAEHEHLGFSPKTSATLSAAIEKGQKFDELNKIINQVDASGLIIDNPAM